MRRDLGLGTWDLGIGNRESGIGNRESQERSTCLLVLHAYRVMLCESQIPSPALTRPQPRDSLAGHVGRTHGQG
ncbi:hypothetical protein LG3211_2627 [Lysobacter gummosus]|nr:hypothetical protein LG3211_2627 [Lysobacter gummosus]